MNLKDRIFRRLFGKNYNTKLPNFDDFDDVMRWLQDPNSDLSNIDFEKLKVKIEQRMAELEAEEKKTVDETAEEGFNSADDPSIKDETEVGTYGLGIEFTRFGTRIAVSVEGIASLLPGGDVFGDGEVRTLLESLNKPMTSFSEMPMVKFLNRVIARAGEYVENRKLASLIVLVPPNLSIRQTNSLALCLREIAPNASRVARACSFAAAQYCIEAVDLDRDNVISCCFDEAGVNLSDICFMFPSEGTGPIFEETCTANIEGLSPGQILWRVTSLIFKRVIDRDVIVRPGMMEKVIHWATIEAEKIMQTPLSAFVEKEVTLDPELFLTKNQIYIQKSDVENIIADSSHRLQAVFERWKASLHFYKKDKTLELLVFDDGAEYPLVEELFRNAAKELFPEYDIHYHYGLSPNSGVLYAAQYYDEIMYKAPGGDAPLFIDANWQDLYLKLSEFEPFSFDLPLNQRPYRFKAEIYPERNWQSAIALCFYQKGILDFGSLIAAYKMPLGESNHLSLELDIDSAGYTDIRLIDEGGSATRHLELEKCDLTKAESEVTSILKIYPVEKLENDRISIGPLARKEMMNRFGTDEDEFNPELDEIDYEDG